jgi:predicted adenine nucleotide alpha hydrolase (AANH) superfamily ATPase
MKHEYGIKQSDARYIFRDFRHSNQTSEGSMCSNVLFIFVFDFCSCLALSKTEEKILKNIN